MSFKDTLKLPQTEMPIKANLPVNEPEVYARWHAEGAYQRMWRGRAGALPGDTFVLHDGPPYANGKIHIGHAMNKILKDFIVKYYYFNGRTVEFVPGWDCHGLPIEQKARDPKDDCVTTRRKCREYAATQVDIQREEFKALGIVADWDNPYTTMDRRNEASILSGLHELVTNHLLFERLKPVHWSWAEQTALAEAEIEYKDRKDPSIYVAFEVTLAPGFGEKFCPSDDPFWDSYKSGDTSCGLLVWTTTPWTLPSNAAVAIHPDEEYVGCWTANHNIMKHDTGTLPHPLVFVAKKRFAALVEKGILKEMEPQLGTVTGRELQAGILTCRKPMSINQHVPVICEEFVDMQTGTGCVHIAPGHGEIDFQIGQKHGLPVYQPVDERGCWTEEVYNCINAPRIVGLANELVGAHVLKFGNDFVIKSLQSRCDLLHEEEITHSYPHCWRSGTPVIFRATKQWYMDLDGLRPAAVDAVENTTFVPETAKNRLLPMVRDRQDWCLSRQRAWGVPLAFLRHKPTGKVWFFEDILGITAAHLSNDMERWWTEDVASFLPEHYKYKPEEFEKITDILDVWFDSGMSWSFIDSLRTRPADVYCEGSDQHRGWFQSSLWLSMALSKEPPFKTIISHGFVVDENGEKMAKSKGNVVSPQKVLEQYGAEVLRYWVATTDYTREMRLSDAILKRCAEGYRKLRNTIRYLVANLDDRRTESLMDGPPPNLKVSQLTAVDQWILLEAHKCFEEVHRLYGEYDFCRGTHMLNDFVHDQLSGRWMTAVKDRLYCGGGIERESAQYTIYRLLKSILGLIAPLFTYTAEEALGYCHSWFRRSLGSSSVGYGATPDVFDLLYHPVLDEEVSGGLGEFYIRALDAFNLAFDRLKQEKVVSDRLEVLLEAGVDGRFPGDEDWYGVSGTAGLDCCSGELLTTFVVDDCEFRVRRSVYEKCPRCWKRIKPDGYELCDRCNALLGWKERGETHANGSK